MSLMGELFCHLSVNSPGQSVDRFIGQCVISYDFSHWKTWDELLNMIIEFDIYLYLSLREALHRQHIYCLASMRLKNCTIMNFWVGTDYGYWTIHTITLVK